MSNIRTLRWFGVAAAALTLPAGVYAQTYTPPGDEMMSDEATPLEFEVRGGLALPVEDLTEYADPGYHFGAGAAMFVSDHVGVRLDGDVSAFPGETPRAEEFADLPDMRLWSLGVGLEFDVGGRDRASPWSLQTNLGVGATTLVTDGFIEPDPLHEGTPALLNIQETYPNLNAGAELGFDAGESIELAVGARAFYVFTDESDLSALQDRRGVTSPLGDAVSMPLTATVRIELPNH